MGLASNINEPLAPEINNRRKKKSLENCPLKKKKE